MVTKFKVYLKDLTIYLDSSIVKTEYGCRIIGGIAAVMLLGKR